MATINLGAIRYNWKGAWSSSTAYVINDVVSNAGNSYVAIQAGTNQTLGESTAYWNIMSKAGTDGTNLATTLTTRGDLVFRNASTLARLAKGTAGQVLGQGANDPAWVNGSSSTLTTQGDILYRDGSGLQRLAKGTAGQALLINSAANAPEWGAAGGGKVLQVLTATDQTDRSTTSTSMVVSSNTLLVNITPSATSSKIYLNCTGFIYHNTTARFAQATIFRDSTNLGNGTKGLSNSYSGGADSGSGLSMSVLDSPSTTNQVAYQVKFCNSGSGVANLNAFNVKSVLTAFEIGA
jgi:hypothetical protein|tara:strand:+ start:447 stop:1328 length:882 start_codon:yes stop_codon:yes gene_type:complete